MIGQLLHPSTIMIGRRTLCSPSYLSCCLYSNYISGTTTNKPFIYKKTHDNRLDLAIPATRIPSVYRFQAREVHGNKDPESNESWFTVGKKLLVLWSAAAVIIAAVAFVDWKVHDKEREPSTRKRKLERVKGNESALQYIFSIPCMRNTVLLTIFGGFTSWIVTFLITSSPKKAYKIGFITPAVIGGLFFTYCSVASYSKRTEADELADVLKDVKLRRAGKRVDEEDEDSVASNEPPADSK